MPSIRPIGQQHQDPPTRGPAGAVAEQDDGGAIVTLPDIDPPDLEPDVGGDDAPLADYEVPEARGPPGRQRFERDDGRPPRRLTAEQRIDRLSAQKNREAARAAALEQEAADLRDRLAKAEGIAATADEAAFANWGNAVAADLEAAKREYQEAVEAGDAAAQTEAQVKLAQAAQDHKTHERLKAQRDARKGQQPIDQRQQRTEPPRSNEINASPAVRAYVQANPWFDQDAQARARVYQLHEQLKQEGVPLESPQYFAAINEALREERPDLDISDHPGTRRRAAATDDDVIDGEQITGARPATRQPARVARGPAPVSRSGGETIGGGQVSATRVRLTPEQREAARISMPNMPAAEREKRYAASLIKPETQHKLRQTRGR